ncbi:MAG: hypothetical protein D6785_04990 [Planctomycetota bacterium]|nr:MAG: hypothetical protein D6785_04990 [Planctomycetota bacterium]
MDLRGAGDCGGDFADQSQYPQPGSHVGDRLRGAVPVDLDRQGAGDGGYRLYPVGAWAYYRVFSHIPGNNDFRRCVRDWNVVDYGFLQGSAFGER